MKSRDIQIVEGADALDRFRKALKTVMSVPKSALPPRPSRTNKKGEKPKG